MPQENNNYFKWLYRILYVNRKIYDNIYNINKLGSFYYNCKRKRENILRALYECSNKYKILKYFLQMIKKLNNTAKMASTNRVLILNALVKDQKIKKLLLSIHITILNEIWRATNLPQHHNKTLTTQQIFHVVSTLILADMMSRRSTKSN